MSVWQIFGVVMAVWLLGVWWWVRRVFDWLDADAKAARFLIETGREGEGMKTREWERFDDVVNDAMILLLDAFIRGGTQEMRMQLYAILPAYARWLRENSAPTDSGREKG